MFRSEIPSTQGPFRYDGSHLRGGGVANLQKGDLLESGNLGKLIQDQIYLTDDLDLAEI